MKKRSRGFTILLIGEPYANLDSLATVLHPITIIVKDGGKAIEIGVRLPDEQYGRILLPFEEIQSMHKLAWSQIEGEAEKKMEGKRVHCRHKVSFHAFMPACCQIGLDNGPHDVNCLGCQFIDGYIEDYDPFKEIQTFAVSAKVD